MPDDYVELEGLAQAGVKIAFCLDEIAHETESGEALSMIVEIQGILERRALPAMAQVKKQRDQARRLVATAS